MSGGKAPDERLETLLRSFVHDYLIKQQLLKTAEVLRREAHDRGLRVSPPAVDAAPNAFLFEWFSFFWDVFVQHYKTAAMGLRADGVATATQGYPPAAGTAVAETATAAAVAAAASVVGANQRVTAAVDGRPGVGVYGNGVGAGMGPGDGGANGTGSYQGGSSGLLPNGVGVGALDPAAALAAGGAGAAGAGTKEDFSPAFFDGLSGTVASGTNENSLSFDANGALTSSISHLATSAGRGDRGRLAGRPEMIGSVGPALTQQQLAATVARAARAARAAKTSGSSGNSHSPSSRKRPVDVLGVDATGQGPVPPSYFTNMAVGAQRGGAPASAGQVTSQMGALGLAVLRGCRWCRQRCPHLHPHRHHHWG
eukprot:TRINITY_DN3493_c0_g1_i3.p1 TRINITY_DN3493_c0_g1~~TRINITY_DN3493_c0_g1_i3.p1  ORF type:complete len:368 (+),score=63.31 TRINITY_DN3493_c0_g1_i3:172-1275(+)